MALIRKSNPDPAFFAEWFRVASAGLEPNVGQRVELELRARFEGAYRDLLGSGLAPEDASRKALEQLGDAEAACELFGEKYGAEMPWDQEFLPKKLPDSEYGYLKGRNLISCTRSELIELCQGAGMNSTDVTLAWTPETEHVVPMETIPFLFEAVKEKRWKAAHCELLHSGLWGALLFAEFFKGREPVSLRHLTLFFGLMTVLPAASGIKQLRAAKALTPETLAREVAENQTRFQLWSGLQTARLTLGLAVACALVTLMPIVAVVFDGSGEAAALVKAATWGGQWWRLLTSVFVHAGLMHLFFNAIGLGIFGHLVEVQQLTPE